MDSYEFRRDGDLVPDVKFTTTLWTVVLTARNPDSAEAGHALEELCRSYWYPLYAFVRRQGHPPEQAQDLTQEFFAHLLAQDFLRNVQAEKGRFRSFLLACLKRFLTDEWRRGNARKRGGDRTVLAMDEVAAELRYLQEPIELANPEAIYERRWALTLLDRVLDRLEAEFGSAGKQAMFDRLQPFLLGERGGPGYAAVAADLGMTEGAIKMAVLRMRERYRALFRHEIEQTVAAPSEVEEEIRHVVLILSR